MPTANSYSPLCWHLFYWWGQPIWYTCTPSSLCQLPKCYWFFYDFITVRNFCALQVGGGKSALVFQMFRSLLHEEGPKGLTKGLSARILAMVPSSLVMVLGYETVKRLSLKTVEKELYVQDEGYLKASFWWNNSCLIDVWRFKLIFTRESFWTNLYQNKIK